jgi:hypothetical protein
MLQMPEQKDDPLSTLEKSGTESQQNPELTQPTSQQPVNNTDLLKQLDELIDRKLAGINDRLARQNTVVAPQPAGPTEEELNTEFLGGNPAGAVKRVLQAQMAGLNSDLQDFKKDRAYSRIRDVIRTQPNIAPYFDKIAPQLDGVVDSLNASQVNHATVELVAKSLIGELVVSGKINPTAPVAPLPNNIPPHLRPAAPVAPVAKTTDAEPELDENQRALARRFGLSPKEFVEGEKGDRMVITSVRKEGAK